MLELAIIMIKKQYSNSNILSKI